MKRLLVWLLVLGLLGASTVAGAQPSGEQLKAARAMANAGLELFKEGDFEQSIERFRAAEAVFHSPMHLLYMARAKRELGAYLDSRNLFQQIVDEELPSDASAAYRKGHAKAKKEAEQAVPELDEKIPAIEVQVEGPPPDAIKVLVDGQDVTASATMGPVRVNPGQHTVRATADGFESAEATVNLEAAKKITPLDFTLQAVAKPSEAPGLGTGTPGSDQAGEEEPGSILPAIIAFSVGGAGLAVGAITGGLAMGKASELDEACPDRNACPTENEETMDSGKTLGTISTVGFIAGGVGVAAGVVLLFLRPGGGSTEPTEPASALVPLVGPGFVGLQGTF
ncbi:MAG: hypothetical protein JRI23_35445 [Deltaproteobacteria bacterium]|jgi:hypothetical protein|nr:hypothetical protein [Deltaproteobacteria bacterium]MBW2537625.1 hypothetical protein [Deltaproteobacteria bacterium]